MINIQVNNQVYSQHGSLELAQRKLEELFVKVLEAGYVPKITNTYLDGTLEGFKYTAGKYHNQINIVL